MILGEGMAEREGICCICHKAGPDLEEALDALICNACVNRIPWECKTARFAKGIGFETRFSEKYILPKLKAEQLKDAIAFMVSNKLLAEQFAENDYIQESGMVIDTSEKLFYFDIQRARMSPALRDALLCTNEPRVIFRAEWIEAFRLDYAYYKIKRRDGSMLYAPQYAQIVLQFKSPVLQNKSVRLDIEQPVLVELMLRRHYEAAAKSTLAALEALTGLKAGAETKTYYERNE